jgi:hypothetical protein
MKLMFLGPIASTGARMIRRLPLVFTYDGLSTLLLNPEMASAAEYANVNDADVSSVTTTVNTLDRPGLDPVHMSV